MNFLIQLYTIITVLLIAAPVAYCASGEISEPEGKGLSNEMSKLVSGDRGSFIDSLVLYDIELRDAARLLSQSWKRPIVVSKESKSAFIDIYLENIYCDDALESICRANNLWFRSTPDSSVIYIESLEEYKSNAQMVQNETVEVITVVYPTVEDLGATLKDVFLDRLVWSTPQSSDINKSKKIDEALKNMDKLADRGIFEQNNYSKSNRQSGALSGLSSSQQRSSYSDSKQADEIESEHKAEMKQIKSIDSLENYQRKPNVVYVAANPTSNTLILRSSDSKALEQVKNVVKQLDVPKPQVLLEVKILELRLEDDNRLGVDWLFQQDIGTGSLYGSSVNGLPDVDGLGGGDGVIDPRAAVFSYISNNFKFRIQALQQEGRVSTLATPSLMVADNEASKLFVGSETVILKQVNVHSDTTTGDNPVTTRTVEPITKETDIGTSLLITPRIHADKTVTIRVAQESSAEGDTNRITYYTDSLGKPMYFDSTDVNQRTVTTTVVAKSGSLVAIGGLISDKEVEYFEKVPLLSEIPYLGKLFQRSAKVNEKTELIVLIRPHIMLAPANGVISDPFLKSTSSKSSYESLNAITPKTNPF